MISALLRFFWIAFCAVAMLLQTLLLVDNPPAGQMLPVAFVFGATLFGYHFSRRPRWQRTLAYAGGSGALLCLWWLPRVMALQVAVPALVWVLYYFAGARSLRRLRLLKPLSIAFVWAWVTVWLPLDPQQWRETCLIFVGRALFIFALALAYDLGDIHHDRRDSLPTLVQHLGEQNTFRWIDKALMLAGLVCIVNYWCKIYGLWAMCALLLSLVWSAWWLRFIRSRPDWEHRQKFWIDALMIAQFIWVLTGKTVASVLVS